MPIGLVLAGLFLGALVLAAGERAGQAIWPVLALVVILFAAGALAAWHRRRMAHLNQLHLVVIGRYANVSAYRSWPKYCTDCGAEMSSWRPCRAHDDEASSPCMKLRLANDAAEAVPGLPMQGYTAEVLEAPAADNGGEEGPALTGRKATEDREQPPNNGANNLSGGVDIHGGGVEISASDRT